MRLTLDSSVLVKTFIKEHDSMLAHELLASCERHAIDVCASDLVIYETGNVLHNTHPKGRSNDAHIEELIHSGIGYYNLEREDAVAIMSLSDEEGLTYYDAAHLHLARKLDSPLVTEDKALLKKKGTFSLAKAVEYLRRLERFES